LTRIQAQVDPALVSERALSNALRLAQRLPDVADNFYFETRLGPSAGGVDLACGIHANDGRRSREQGAERLRRWVEEELPGSGLGAFLERWSAPMLATTRAWPALWLGFEAIEDDATRGLPPCVSFAIGSRLGVAERGQGVARLVSKELQTLRGHALDSATSLQVENVFGYLPVSGRVMYVSVMLPRPELPIKFNVLLPRTEVDRYLSSLGWQGAMTQLTRVLTTYAPHSQMIRLDLTLGATGGRCLGIEMLSKGLAQTRTQAEELSQTLHVNALCDDAQLEALKAWWGHSTERHPSEDYSSCLTRNWYCKLCLDSDSKLRAKAYLGFGPRPFPLFPMQDHAQLQQRHISPL
jgi:hypothetical protein